MLGIFSMLTVYSAEKNLQGDPQQVLEMEKVEINAAGYRSVIVPQFFKVLYISPKVYQGYKVVESDKPVDVPSMISPYGETILSKELSLTSFCGTKKLIANNHNGAHVSFIQKDKNTNILNETHGETRALAFSGNALRCAVGTCFSNDFSQVTILDCDTKQRLFSYRIQPEKVNCIALNENGTQLAVAMSHRYGFWLNSHIKHYWLRVIDLKKNKLLYNLCCYKKRIACLRFINDTILRAYYKGSDFVGSDTMQEWDFNEELSDDQIMTLVKVNDDQKSMKYAQLPANIKKSLRDYTIIEDNQKS